MSNPSQIRASGASAVLASGGERLVLSAALLRRLVDTAHVLEAEVALLRLEAAFETEVHVGPSKIGQVGGPATDDG